MATSKALAGAIVLALSAAAAAACSGTSSSALFNESGGGAGTGGDTSDAATGGTEGGTGGGDGGGGGKNHDASANDGGTTTQACANGSGFEEVEPDDSASTANVLPPNTDMCGKIAASNDVDFYKFILPETTQNMSITFTGQVKVIVNVNGTTITLTPGTTQSVPVEKGKLYVLDVQTNDGSPHDYVLRLNLT